MGDPAKRDFDRFLKTAPRLFGDVLESGRKITVARAPARLDVMGGIADYCGSLVLEMPLREATLVAVQKRRDRRFVVRSVEAEREGLSRDVTTFSLDDFMRDSRLIRYDQLREKLETEPAQAWAAYVLGVFFVLQKEGVAGPFRTGANICIRSTVPFGAGIASSAALEVAAMQAVLAAYKLRLDGLETARLAQMVENRVVGAPCGIMDQVTSVLGRERSLLALRCQPHNVEGTVSIPKGYRFVGIDSRVKHAVGGSRYTDTRVGAFMGHRIILSHLEAKRDPYDGFLARITPREFTKRFRRILPSRMAGAEFLKMYKKTHDPVTTVDPHKIYAVRSRVEHPIYENHRVEQFREILQHNTNLEEHAALLGKLMYGSHWSYGNRCAMGSPETDLLVSLVREKGPRQGLFGAKITGGGSGGTVAVLAADGTDDLLADIMQRYHEQTGREPRIFNQSSPGAEAVGTVEFKP